MALFLVLAGALAAQSIPGLKTYKTQEDYCFDNPHAPTCVNGKPMKMLDLTKPGLNAPLSNFPPRQPQVRVHSGTAQSAARPQNLAPNAKPLNLKADWRFAHPRAELLAGMNVEALRESPTVRELLAKLAAQFQIAPADLDNMLARAGEMDQAWLSMRSKDVLILLQGKLNLPDGFFRMSNGMTMYRISSSAVLMGKEASVLQAVQRLKSTAPEAAAARQMKELSAENQIWITATQALMAQAKASSAQAKASPLAAGVTGLSLTMQLQDGFRMDALLNCAGLAAARKVLASAQEKPPLPDASMKVDIRLEGTSVRITLGIDKEHLSQVLDKALTSPMGQQLKALAGAAHKPGTVQVQGLPEGTQQVQPSGGIVAVPTQPTAQLGGGITIQGGSTGASRH